VPPFPTRRQARLPADVDSTPDRNDMHGRGSRDRQPALSSSVEPVGSDLPLTQDPGTASI